jgi:Family of unknown function (DUF5752)
MFRWIKMMSKPIPKAKSQPQAPQPKTQALLGSVPFENGFHFYIALGKYTGITVNSLSEFAEKLQVIPVESVVFHFQRDDFQKWIRDEIGDEQLAKRLDELKHWPSWSSEENLRKELVKTVQKRISELT